MKRFCPAVVAALLFAGVVHAQVYNVKVVTDASPDYSDMQALVHSITNKWPTMKEKCWAVFYWNHIARRQTSPMHLHGMELTDPIRQFNDYGFTMCSTVAGINNAIWHHMGMKTKYWDITAHSVPECFYDGRWHMYDSSMSALYTLCDGKTIAGVRDIGKTQGCPASDGKEEFGHIANYHCLNATGVKSFLTGADCYRELDQEARCFNPNGLRSWDVPGKFTYLNQYWDWGHRYLLNLRDRETYTRFYHRLDKPELDRDGVPVKDGKFTHAVTGESVDTKRFYVPNTGEDPKVLFDPERGYRLRGNGAWVFRPDLSPAGWKRAVQSDVSVVSLPPGRLQPAAAGRPAEVVFKLNSANVTTAMTLAADVFRKSEDDRAAVSVSTNNGLSWKEVWKAEGTGKVSATVELLEEVNGAYETLIKVTMLAKAAAPDVALESLEVETTTEVNAKTQPRLNLGRNTVYVGTGEQTDSIVFWPDLQGSSYKEHIAEERNIANAEKHPVYKGAVWPAQPNEDAYLVYRMDAPNDIVRVTFGGRFYNRASKSRIELYYSLDGAKTWTKSWTLTDTTRPWDVIHYETVDVPRGHRSVWLKYLMNSPEAASSGCSIYSVRMEADYRPAAAAFKPMEVTFTWNEVQQDRSLLRRSHTQRVGKVPFRYVINVGGADQPVMASLRVNLEGAVPDVKYGYADGVDVGGEKFVGRWLTTGRNLAVGKSYKASRPDNQRWDSGDPDGTKLTDGLVGPPYAGGIASRWGVAWEWWEWEGKPDNPVSITLDLGKVERCASFGLNANGYGLLDVLKGEVKDKVEVFVSNDGKDYKSVGFLVTDLRWKDLPVNHMWPDWELIQGHTFRVIPEKPVTARYVRYDVTPRRFFCITELEVLDSIRLEPFDLRIALPDEVGAKASVYPHGVLVRPLEASTPPDRSPFAGDVRPPLRARTHHGGRKERGGEIET